MQSLHLNAPESPSRAAGDAQQIDCTGTDSVAEPSQHPHYRTRVCSAFMAGRPCPAPPGRCFHAHGYGQLRADAAVALGFLDPSFRTVLCHAWLADGHCPAQERCTFAHGLQERRVEAAIILGALPRHYKTRVCHAFSANLRSEGDPCPLGHRCYFAHGVHEIRVDAAIELGVLPPSFKTRVCSAWANSGCCPVAERCLFAHGARELRVDAAIALGVLPGFFKTRLCSSWATGCGCPKGEKCYYAHGVEDLRTSSIVPGAPAVGDPSDALPPPLLGLPTPTRHSITPPQQRSSFDGVPLSHRSQHPMLLHSPLRAGVTPVPAHVSPVHNLNAHLMAAFDQPQPRRASLDAAALHHLNAQRALHLASHGSTGSDLSGSDSSMREGRSHGSVAGVRTPRGTEAGQRMYQHHGSGGCRDASASDERSASPPQHDSDGGSDGCLNLPTAEDFDAYMTIADGRQTSSGHSSGGDDHGPSGNTAGDVAHTLAPLGGPQRVSGGVQQWPKLPMYVSSRRASLDEGLLRRHALW